ncbi:MAG: hypothetical protein MUO82_02075 [Candidatus Thermoplasmatota archaeon]|nr:hypothetical protein [Candidatus Thermoplasmatota archaeon]
MRKQLMIVGIIAILLIVGLSGCTNTNTNNGRENNKFFGTWIGSETIPNVGLINIRMTFMSNGTFNICGGEGIIKTYASGYWDIKDGLLIINGEYGKRTYSYLFSNNYKSLIITSTKDTEKFVLTKQ